MLLAYQGPKQHSTASKPGANRLEAPINYPNSQLCHTLDAHFLYRRLYRFVYNAALMGLSDLSDFTQVWRYAENRSQ